MKRKLIAVTAAAAAVALSASACSSSKSAGTGGAPAAAKVPALTGPTANAAGTVLNVWLVSDPKDNPDWMKIVNDATASFKAKTGADIKINWQTWPDHLTSLDAALQGKSDVPDIIELGNTEAAKYAFSGALADVSSVKSTFDNSASWLTGLSAPCTDGGHLYCVPYYAGTRALVYRTDLLADAGVTSFPKTFADFTADLDAVKAKNASNPNFITFNLPGQDWYEMGSFVYGAGGSIAVKTGDQWKGNLSSAASQQGLQQWADMVKKYSSPTTATVNENDQDKLFITGNVFSEYDSAWHSGAVQQVHSNPNDSKSPLVDTPVKGKVDIAPMPGATADKPSPAFLGGSVLGIAEKSKNQALAAEWIQAYTSSESNVAEGGLGNLPNNTVDLAKVAGSKAVSQQLADQAKSSWFTPNSGNWANVESSKVLQNMLEDIATGKSSVADAAKAADDQITTILNAKQ